MMTCSLTQVLSLSIRMLITCLLFTHIAQGGDKYLFVDLDETLLYYRRGTLHFRPGAVDFLIGAKNDYWRVCTWTSSVERGAYLNYGKVTASLLQNAREKDPTFSFTHNFYREHCTKYRDVWVKNLDNPANTKYLIDVPLSDMILVDDHPDRVLPVHHVIPIMPWYGTHSKDQTDSEFKKVIEQLNGLKEHDISSEHIDSVRSDLEYSNVQQAIVEVNKEHAINYKKAKKDERAEMKDRSVCTCNVQ